MTRLTVHVTPRSRSNEIHLEGNLLKVRLTAPPVDGAANDALIALLAERLQLPKRSIQVVQGTTSRHKVITIEGLSTEAITSRLQ